jgi:hypothetical protein
MALQYFVGWCHTSEAWDTFMELRHLRYFVAVAEEGSLTVAAERRLHTAQPSLSRQIRDLEYEVGNLAVLKKDEWNVLVDLIQSGQLGRV